MVCFIKRTLWKILDHVNTDLYKKEWQPITFEEQENPVAYFYPTRDKTLTKKFAGHMGFISWSVSA